MFREHVPSKISIAEPVNDTCKAESLKTLISSPVPSKNPPTTAPHVKTTKSSIGSNADGYRTRSGRIVQKPPRYHE